MAASAETERKVAAARAYLNDHPDATQREVAEHVGLAQSTLSKRLRDPAAPDGADGLDQIISPGEVPVIFRDYSDQEVHHVYPMGDVHKGSPNHLLGHWNEWLDYLRSTNGVSLLGTGDLFNAALRDSVSDVYDEVLTVGAARKELTSELRPLAEADKLDALARGNHEGRIVKATGDCPVDVICDTLGVPYIAGAAMIVYKVGDIEYEVYLRHGTGSGRPGAQANRLERQALVMQADVYISGHTHQQQVIRGGVFVREGLQVRRRRQVYVSSGSFLSYEDYAAAAGLPPGDIGAPRIRLDGTKRDVHVSV